MKGKCFLLDFYINFFDWYCYICNLLLFYMVRINFVDIVCYFEYYIYNVFYLVDRKLYNFFYNSF